MRWSPFMVIVQATLVSGVKTTDEQEPPFTPMSPGFGTGPS
jgi:hypothetical protein